MAVVLYCDLCLEPVKEEFYLLYFGLASKTPELKSLTDYYDYICEIKTQSKVICPTCKKIFDTIFQLRLQNLNCLSAELLGIYNLPSIPNPIERTHNKKIKNVKKTKK